MSRALDKLRQIGFRPVLLARYAAHKLTTRARRARLRRIYARRVAEAPIVTRLLAPQLDLRQALDLPSELREAGDYLRLEAESILRHEVDFLGSGPVSLGEPIDWHRDFKSGFRWPQSFYQDVEVTRLTDHSDAKVPWELSRGHHLLTLARAARIFDDDRYVQELESQLAHWIDGNPPGVGINWTNPMEAGIRAVNWAWAVGTAEGKRPLRAGLRSEVIRSLQAHGRHIAANLEGTPYLRSNHYLGDILGLLVLGWALPEDPAAKSWLRIARRGFEREVLRQVHSDGVSFEASLPYHGLALEMFLLARLVATWTGTPLSARFDDRVRRMLAVSRALRHPGGRTPQFGDGDSGRILPAGFARTPSHDHLLWMGAALMGGERPLSKPPHEEVAWNLGVAAWQRAAGLPEEPPPRSTPFRQSGLFVLREGRTHVAVRCGDVGQNGNGGHAHNDLTSFEASFGAPLVVDAGTYVYTADPFARNRFRSATAHNVLLVDEEEPNVIEPDLLFALRPRAVPRLVHWRSDDAGTVVEVGHDGFSHVSNGGELVRTFELSPSGVLSVVDQVGGEGLHDLSLRVQLAPATVVARIEDWSVNLRTPTGAGAQLRTAGLPAISIEQGWVADTYGQRKSAPLVVWRWRGELPARTELRLSPVCLGSESG